MKILVHDYAGHPFQLQLSRWLAAQDNDVLHCYCPDFETPRGNTSVPEGGRGKLDIRAVSMGAPVQKYQFARRILQERAYGAKMSGYVADFGPDIVISSNVQPSVQKQLQRAAKSRNAQFIYWLQDIYCYGAERALKSKLPVGAPLVAAAARRYEFAAMASSDAVIAITEDFVPLCLDNGVPAEKLAVIRNWAPLDEVPRRPRDNAWARAHGLSDKFVFLSSGTLGLKHNPSLLSSLAKAMKGRPDVAVVVVSQGMGRQWLEEKKRAEGLDNLLLFDFQPFEVLPDVLASSDVLIAILEPFAGVLSVPSKISTYLCTERPILAAIPSNNLGARLIEDAAGGVVVSPLDNAAFVDQALRLIDDPDCRNSYARSGRSHAERTFDINRIGSLFSGIFNSLTDGNGLGACAYSPR